MKYKKILTGQGCLKVILNRMKKSVVLDNRRKPNGVGLKLRSDHNNIQYNWLEIAKIGSREKNKSWLEKLRLKAISAFNLKLKSNLSSAKLCLKEDAKECTQAKRCAGKLSEIE